MSFYQVAISLVIPRRVLVIAVVCWLGLRLLKRRPRARRWILGIGIAQFAIFSLHGTAELLVLPLEAQFERPKSLPDDVDAVVVLGGSTRDSYRRYSRVEFKEEADRFVEGVRLARKLPPTRLIFSGGTDDGYDEGKELVNVAGDLGIEPGRISYEIASRSTRTNAVEVRKMFDGRQPRIVLVTSAMHLPRAAACFRKLGFDVVGWPTDFQHRGRTPWLMPFPSDHALHVSTRAIHEYVGFIYYYLADYI